MKNKYKVYCLSYEDMKTILDFDCVDFKEYETHYSFDFLNGYGTMSKERIIKIVKL